MSCIRFVGGPVGNGGPPLPFSSPKSSIGKFRRLVGMAHSADWEIRQAAAGNPMTPVRQLISLAKDKDIHVRSWVARNPECPEAVLRYMRDNDSEMSIREFAKYELQRRQDVIDSKE